MAHNFVPEPPPQPPDDTKELPHEDMKRIHVNLDLNKICYCGGELLQFRGQQHNDWTCSSCYKLIFNDYVPSYMCPHSRHNRDVCLFAKISGHGFNICRDCYDGIDDLKEIDSTENDKSLIFQKLNHTLHSIS